MISMAHGGVRHFQCHFNSVQVTSFFSGQEFWESHHPTSDLHGEKALLQSFAIESSKMISLYFVTCLCGGDLGGPRR